MAAAVIAAAAGFSRTPVELLPWFSPLTTSVHSPGALWALIAALVLVESVVLDSCSDTTLLGDWQHHKLSSEDGGPQ